LEVLILLTIGDVSRYRGPDYFCHRKILNCVEPAVNISVQGPGQQNLDEESN
jgi:hypothetical protein